MIIHRIISRILKDSKGMLFSTDLLLSLVVITVTIGISANTMDQVGGMIHDYSYRSSLERNVLETVDILIKTPGSPDNWENCSSINGEYEMVSPGLAKINQSDKKVMPGTLSYKKITALQKGYDKIIPGKLLPRHISSSMAIYPVNSQLKPIIIKNQSENIDSPEIVVVNRTIQYDVMCDNIILFLNTASKRDTCPEKNLFNGEKEDICPHENSNNYSTHNPYDSPSHAYWICKYFIVTLEDLNKTDYYLISDNSNHDFSFFGVLDTANNRNDERIYFNSGAIKLNDRIHKLVGNQTKTAIWFHLFVDNPQKSKQVYIVGVPRNTSADDIKLENFQAQPAYFIFKAWVE